MYEKVLLAYDGSPDGHEALAQAKSLASALGATVHLLAIIDPSENMVFVEGTTIAPDNREFVMQSVLDAGVKRLQSVGCMATNDVRFGNPAEQIALAAKEMNADFDRRRSSRSRDACTLVQLFGWRVDFASSALQRAGRGEINTNEE